jgi:hypothetical protein
MNFSAIILGFVAMALIAGMIVFIGATQSVQVVDSYGNTTNSVGNATNGLVSNVTSVGGLSSGYLVLIIMALGFIAAVGMLLLYSKSR